MVARERTHPNPSSTMKLLTCVRPILVNYSSAWLSDYSVLLLAIGMSSASAKPIKFPLILLMIFVALYPFYEARVNSDKLLEFKLYI